MVLKLNDLDARWYEGIYILKDKVSEMSQHVGEWS